MGECFCRVHKKYSRKGRGKSIKRLAGVVVFGEVEGVDCLPNMIRNVAADGCQSKTRGEAEREGGKGKAGRVRQARLSRETCPLLVSEFFPKFFRICEGFVEAGLSIVLRGVRRKRDPPANAGGTDRNATHPLTQVVLAGPRPTRLRRASVGHKSNSNNS
jgi:hypothetical protein